MPTNTNTAPILSPPVRADGFSFRRACAPGLAALRRQWKPFVLIQIVALALVLGYYFVPGVDSACAFVATLKERGGAYAAAVAAALAGALLPELAKVATGSDPRTNRQKIEDLGFNTVFFGINGWVVYEFYRLQAYLFGTELSVVVIAKKVAVDLLVFAAFWSVPFGLVAFAWKRNNFSFSATLPDIAPAVLMRRAPAMVIPMWAFWLPIVSMVYALPAALQFGLFTLTLGAWSLLLVFITGGDESEES